MLPFSQVSHCHCACVAAGEGGAGGAAGRGRCHNSYMWPGRRQLSWQSGPEIKTFRLTIFIDAIIDCVFMAWLLWQQHCSCSNMLPAQQQHSAARIQFGYNFQRQHVALSMKRPCPRFSLFNLQ